MPTFLWPVAPICLTHQSSPLSYVFIISELPGGYLTCAYEQSSHSPLLVVVCCSAKQESPLGALAWFPLPRRCKIPMALNTHHLSLVSHKIAQENSPSRLWVQGSEPSLYCHVHFIFSPPLRGCSFHSSRQKVLGGAWGQPDPSSPFQLHCDLGSKPPT